MSVKSLHVKAKGGKKGSTKGSKSPSYLAVNLNPTEEDGFKAAGVLPWRINDNEQIEILMGVNPRGQKEFFGGKRDNLAETSLDVAVREFNEEANLCLCDGPSTLLQSIMYALINGPVAWIRGGKYVLHFLNLSKLEPDEQEFIMALPIKIPNSINAHGRRHQCAEMASAQWCLLDDIVALKNEDSFRSFIPDFIRDVAFIKWAACPEHPIPTRMPLPSHI